MLVFAKLKMFQICCRVRNLNTHHPTLWAFSKPSREIYSGSEKQAEAEETEWTVSIALFHILNIDNWAWDWLREQLMS